MQDAILSALQPFDLKAAGRNQYRCNSPLRPGSNSHAFAVTIDPDAPGGGIWFDHVADKGGDFLDLAPMLDIAVPTSTKPKTPPKERVYTSLADYAQAHGVPAPVLAAAGWTKSIWRHKDGRVSPALKYPTPNGDRYRLIDGDNPKYIQKPGYKACMYGIVRAVRLAEQTGQPLVLCNGEVSTIVAQHFGVAACAQNMGEKKITPENLAQLQAEYPVGEILLTPDCDPTGRKTAGELYTQLTNAGYSVRILDLNGADGFDLANFATLHQHDTVDALRALPEIPPPQGDASLYLREMERLRQDNEQLRAELQTYKEREQWQAHILRNDKLGAADKVTALVMHQVVDVGRDLVDRVQPNAAVPVAYKHIAQLAGQSTSTVARSVKVLEASRMWTCDPEIAESGKGYNVLKMRVQPLDAFDDPKLLQPPEKKRGGARPGAGRKPKCPDCPTGTVHRMIIEQTAIYHCPSHGEFLREQLPDIVEDYVAEESIQFETGEDLAAAPVDEAVDAESDTVNQFETGVVNNLTTVANMPAVPPILEETVDLTAAILCADRLPLELSDLQRRDYQTALNWLHKHRPDKAEALIERIQVPQAQAIVAHLAARPMAQAVAA